MDAQALRAMQAPIKDRYKDDPKAAFITLKARGTLDDTHIACKVETGRALAMAGLHPATGGTGLELCSGDMLLEALVACAGVTLRAESASSASRGERSSGLSAAIASSKAAAAGSVRTAGDTARAAENNGRSSASRRVGAVRSIASSSASTSLARSITAAGKPASF